jgi:hypothetical protein
MLTLADSQLVNGLLFNCALRSDEKACAVMDSYLALMRIAHHLEVVVDLDEQLEDLGFSPPVGPEPPAPIDGVLIKDLGLFLDADGDPDGAPARIFPTAGLSNNPGRLKAGLKSAILLRKGLLNVAALIEKDIAELERKVKP